jgi:L-seryl-tRNA(Ser) seleniumtransferase
MPGPARSDLYRKLPSVDEVMRTPAVLQLLEMEGQPVVAQAVRMVLSRLRQEIATSELDERALELALSGLEEAVERQVRRDLRYSLRKVINATGVILHTNLGRAPLGVAALEHIRESSAGYSNLEFDVGTGERGKRDVHVDRLFRNLLANYYADPQEVSTIVVNNNAAAVLLALNTLAEGGEVIVSRGELVEIGGSFRVPDIMSKSGALLREVGTTNRTRISDYEHAINEKTRLLLRVHRSNFEITGYTEQPSLTQLAELARSRGLPLMEDLGSGALVDLTSIGIHGEPGVIGSLTAGVDVVTYSGDKLLGGPQAGLVSGREQLIARIRSNPLFRALRVDKLTYAALESTLLAYVKQEYESIPALRMMRLAPEEIGSRAQRVLDRVKNSHLQLEICQGESLIGGGAAPSAVLPTFLVSISSDTLSADELAHELREHEPPVVARVEQGRLLLDLRTVFPEEDQWVAAALSVVGSER